MSKRLIKSIALGVLMLVLFPISASAQRTGVVNEVAFSHDGETLTIYVDFETYNCLNDNVSLVAYFYNTQGVPLKDFNGQYCSGDGQVSAQANITPGYVSTEFDDVEIDIPVSELHLPNGTNYIMFTVRLYAGGAFISNNEGQYNLTVTIN
ncbi:MAG: hypothetical protein R3Y61_08000 [Rikenellaceae bacterium]